MEESSKMFRDDMAGHHGEGVKLAALVMRRLGHSVRIESSSFYWIFNFGPGDTLCCRLSEPSSTSMTRKKNAYAEQMTRPANVWEDVTFEISKRRDTFGHKIEEAEFRQWMTVALDLDVPDGDDIIRNQCGVLILGHTYSRCVYLKGLRVAGHGPDGRLYRYGYNLLAGRINRDRECMVNQLEEAQMIAIIWEQPILKEGDRMPTWSYFSKTRVALMLLLLIGSFHVPERVSCGNDY
ncbi:uncharacterized protein A1O9_06313 [Exophiala aquamarina CBS 119918]|uniref:Uncharacterized protein n=1 Tax=Exophiala aquamarina CBS 119918 TaxID=1182545 RepID=A0A072PF56_9EURO|nr:uncharacterized protein A1O9_06313 [Exophiala aquamarina CBS 119918]KEF58387.1 hypothetical protein A1O9_06313 [Exophiala aquamarina CBS 119918]